MFSNLTDMMREQTSKLVAVYVVGMGNWIVDLDKWAARIGLYAGAFAGVMLIVIRWDDMMRSGPIVRWRGRLRRWIRILKVGDED